MYHYKKIFVFSQAYWPLYIYIEFTLNLRCSNRIGGVMISVLASSVVDRGFKPQSGQNKDYKIDICCFSAKHTALRSKSKDWLAQIQNDVSEGTDLSTRGLLF